MPQITTTFIEHLMAIAFYPIWILGGMSVVGIGIYGAVRCFQLDRKASGFGLIALVLVWLAVQPLYLFATFVAAYCEAHCTITRIFVTYLGYVGLAGILCFSILRSHTSIPGPPNPAKRRPSAELINLSL